MRQSLSFADVSRHFHLPLTQAAELLNVCVTLVKRVCRENGVSRWPYRKLQSRRKRELIRTAVPAQHPFAPTREQPRSRDGSHGDAADSSRPSAVREMPPSGTMLPTGTMLLQAACKRLGFIYAEVWAPVASPSGGAPVLALRSCSVSEDDPSDPMRVFASASGRISLACGSGLPGRVWATAQPEWSTDCSSASLGLATAAGIPLLGTSGSYPFLGVAVFFATQRAASTVEIMQALGNVGKVLALHAAGLPFTPAAIAQARQQAQPPPRQPAAQPAAPPMGPPAVPAHWQPPFAAQPPSLPQLGPPPQPLAPPVADPVRATAAVARKADADADMLSLTDLNQSVTRVLQEGITAAERDPTAALLSVTAQLHSALRRFGRSAPPDVLPGAERHVVSEGSGSVGAAPGGGDGVESPAASVPPEEHDSEEEEDEEEDVSEDKDDLPPPATNCPIAAAGAGARSASHSRGSERRLDEGAHNDYEYLDSLVTFVHTGDSPAAAERPLLRPRTSPIQLLRGV